MITAPGRTARASRSTSSCATAWWRRSARVGPGSRPTRRSTPTGSSLLPGFVDLHTHLREPGGEESETIATGSAAAALGGFTAVFAMPNTAPVVDTDVVALHVRRRGAEVGLVDVHPVGAVTVGLRGERMAELGTMARSPAQVRMFSDDGRCVHDPLIMRRALEYATALDVVIAQHAEDHRLTGGAQAHEGEVASRLGLAGWPATAEETIVARDCALAREAGARLHVCHVSSAHTIDVLRAAKAAGVRVSAEVTPHHLLLTDARLAGYDPVNKVNPPLRTGADTEAMRAALAEGVIDVVATDHAPHAAQYKDTEWDAARPGMLGLQTALSVVVHTMVEPGLLDWRGVARVLSERPAEIGGLPDQGRPIAVGEPATFALVDPDGVWTVRGAQLASRASNTPYEGMRLPATVVATVWRGRVTAEGREGGRMTAVLVLEDGRIFRGEPYGALGQGLGEAVFTTGMTGYQETLTDPSYHRQIVVQTAPQIGNTGWNDEDDESGAIQVAGYVVRDPARTPSNWRSRRPLDEELRRQGIVGVAGVDTRALVRHLREQGAMRSGVFSGDALAADDVLVERVRQSPPMEGADLYGAVTTREPYVVPADGETRFRVAALDVGIKSNTPRMLAARGIETHVLPAETTIAEIEALAPDGFFLSNGPGDPATADVPVALTRAVLERRIPLFGICFGNQILARALGRGTYKLRYGHRGINIPVVEHATGRVAITSQNHGFAVQGEAGERWESPFGPAEITHTCPNDGCVEGLRALDVPAFSVQYHPEAAAGPHDAADLFDRFVELMEKR